MWKVNSPDGELEMTISQGADGALWYQVSKHGKVGIANSRLGILTDLGNFVKGLSFEREERNEIHEEYSIPVGKKAVYKNDAKELALYFSAHGAEFAVRARALDDGAAFRYEIRMPEGEKLHVKGEATEFQLGENYDTMWLQDWVPTYEGPYNSRTWDKSVNGQPFGMPSLFRSETDNEWIMINEANILNTEGNYCSCNLVGNENKCMTIGFAPEEKGRPLTCRLPFASPWRYIVAADSLDELVNSTINYNLNPPSTLEDTSWITPGRALWSWWEDMNGAQLYLESRNYVDMAAAYGFEGLTLDCGWDACWVPDLCEYAHKKGVKIWIWTPMQ